MVRWSNRMPPTLPQLAMTGRGAPLHAHASGRGGAGRATTV